MIIKKIKALIIKTVNSILSILYNVYRNIFKGNKIINKKYLIENYYKSKLLIEVNPLEISYYLPVGEVIEGVYHKRCYDKMICEGKWKSQIKLIDEHRKTKGMYELFKENGQYNKTKAYKQHVCELKSDQLNTKNEPPGEVLDSMKKIRDYYCNNFELYNRIKYNGFISQRHLGKNLQYEVGIVIDKDGEIYRFGNGYHRMAIARYLKLSKIPVAVRLIHRDWYEYCRHKYCGDPIEGVITEVNKRNYFN